MARYFHTFVRAAAVLLSLLLLPGIGKAQLTITCYTAPNNGSSMATFNFTNNNVDPVQITGISSWTTSASNAASLWYKTTPINGNPAPVSTANGWTQIGPQAGTFPTGLITPMMSNINLVIPAGATYGLASPLLQACSTSTPPAPASRSRMPVAR